MHFDKGNGKFEYKLLSISTHKSHQRNCNYIFKRTSKPMSLFSNEGN